jgi:hypothetical protein
MDQISMLEKRLRKPSMDLVKRTRLLHGIYQQLVVSRKGNQHKGEYRQYMERGEEQSRAICDKVYGLLLVHGMDNHARRLAEQRLPEYLPNHQKAYR